MKSPTLLFFSVHYKYCSSKYSNLTSCAVCVIRIRKIKAYCNSSKVANETNHFKGCVVCRVEEQYTELCGVCVFMQCHSMHYKVFRSIVKMLQSYPIQ